MCCCALEPQKFYCWSRRVDCFSHYDCLKIRRKINSSSSSLDPSSSFSLSSLQAAERDYEADEEIFLWSGRFSESESGNLGNLVPPKLSLDLASKSMEYTQNQHGIMTMDYLQQCHLESFRIQMNPVGFGGINFGSSCCDFRGCIPVPKIIAWQVTHDGH